MSMMLDPGPPPPKPDGCYRASVQCTNCGAPQPEAHPKKGETVFYWCAQRTCRDCGCQTLRPEAA